MVIGNPIIVGGSGGGGFSPSDEGKVVSNGALVAQGSQTVTQNGTYDTTLISELIANISGGGGSTNILSGTSAPSANQGSNGDLYLEYIDSGQLPSGLTKIGYVGTNGGSQYVDLGYLPKTNTYIEMILSVSYGYGSSGGFIFGERSSSYSNSASFELTLTGTTTSINKHITLNGSGGTISDDFYTYDKIIKIKATRDNVQVLYDNQIIHNITIPNANPSDSSRSLYLFALNNYGSSTGAKCKLYDMKIYEGEQLVHRYIPVKDSNDVACLYDTEDHETLYSAISTQLNAGDEGGSIIIGSYVKKNGSWQQLDFSNIEDVNLG